MRILDAKTLTDKSRFYKCTMFIEIDGKNSTYEQNESERDMIYSMISKPDHFKRINPITEIVDHVLFERRVCSKFRDKIASNISNISNILNIPNISNISNMRDIFYKSKRFVNNTTMIKCKVVTRDRLVKIWNIQMFKEIWW